MAGYTRQSAADITANAVIKATPINAELNALLAAFNKDTGHKHDGTTAEGAFVPLIADTDGLNKILVDQTNNRFGVFVEVSSTATEQVRFQDGAIIPVTDNDIDLGGSTLEFKDLYLDGTAHIDTLDVDANAGIIGALTVTGVTALNGGLTMDSNKFTVADTSGNTAIAGTLVVTGATTLAATSFGDANITNVGNIALDSITADGSTITITGNTTFADGAFDFNIASHDTSNGLKLGGTLVTSTAAELNILDGVTSTTAELNLLDGVTSTTAELNILDGVTSTAAELNILDGVTSTAAELNILDGVTSTATELNLLDGVTATTAELNYNDTGAAVGTVVASKTVTADANKDVTGLRNVTASGNIIIGDGANIGSASDTDAIAIASDGDVTVSQNLLVSGNLTVTGTQTVVDTVTMNAANALVFEGATADDHETTLTIVDPTADRTINLPNQSGTLALLAAASNVAITSTPAELNLLDGVTATTAELNLLDGVTATTTELNIIDGVTATTAELNIMDGGTSVTSTTLADADGVVVNDAGTMKQVAMSDINTYMQNNLNTQANLTTVGALNAGSITSGFGTINIGSSAFTTTGAVNFGSLNDGTIGVTAFVDEDNMSSNSATLIPTQQSVKAYVDSVSATANNVTGLTATGAELNILDDATVTTAELNILDGSATTQATVTLAGTDGVVISDADVMKQALVSDFDTYMATTTKTLTNKTLTSAVLNGTTLVGGDFITASNADLDLAPHGTGTVVVRGNSNSGAVVFNCESNSHGQKVFGQPHSAGVTNTLMLPAGSNSTLVSLVSTDTLTNKTLTSPKINEDVAVTSTASEINALDLGSTAVGTAIASKAVILDSSKDYTGIRNFSITGNLSVGGTTTVVNTVTMNSQNAVLFEGATADAHETTLSIVDPTADRTINLPNQSGTIPVLAAASNTAITSTPEELNVLDGITAVVGELNALDIGSTAVGTAVASKAVILDSNKDYTGLRNLTITGELVAATLDISGAIDVAGTTNLDVVDVDGAANFAADVTIATGADIILLQQALTMFV